MNRHVALVTATVEALRFTSMSSATWFGQPAIAIPRRLSAVLTPAQTWASVEYLLQHHLYETVYGAGIPRPMRTSPLEGPPEVARTAFVEQLSAANAGRGGWDPGWRLESQTEDTVRISKLGLCVSTARRRVRMSGPEHREGELALTRSKELPSISPGFYVALGDIDLGLAESRRLVRWYWNLTAAGAEPFVRHLTRALNGAGIAFQLKTLSDPAGYQRCDAAVLYLGRDDVASGTQVIEHTYPLLRPFLKDAVPAFTKQLAPGLALAEDPPGSESFGMHRCKLLAGGLVEAAERGDTSTKARVGTVLAHLERHGVSIDAPYFNQESDLLHDGELDVHVRASAGPLPPGPVLSSDLGADPYVETAIAIGRELVSTAIWSGSECTWMGPDRSGVHGFTGVAHYRPIGADLYAGAAGIAWFLGALHETQLGAGWRRTALGAMHHALGRCEDAEPGGIGLFDGVIGVALVASRLAVTLDEPELAERARAVLDKVATAEPASADLTSGSAGAVVGLLACRTVLGETLVCPAVTRLGEHLLDTAQESAEGTSWAWKGQPTFRNPTGYSHGTAGIALALDELYEFRGDHRFRRCAAGARSYERHAFAPDVGNWADYRLAPGERRRRAWTPRYATAWCHGAPGIAVARLRALELSDDPVSRDEALVALETTRSWLRGALSVSSPDFSLCHGIAGNVQIVERCERALGVTGGHGMAPVIDHGVRRFRAQPGAGDEAPGLMNGLAGIGAFFLGRAGLTAPQPLFITGAGIGA